MVFGVSLLAFLLKISGMMQDTSRPLKEETKNWMRLHKLLALLAQNGPEEYRGGKAKSI